MSEAIIPLEQSPGWLAVREVMAAIVRLCPQASSAVWFVVDVWLRRALRAKMNVLLRQAEAMLRPLIHDAARAAGPLETPAKTAVRRATQRRPRPEYHASYTQTWGAGFRLVDLPRTPDSKLARRTERPRRESDRELRSRWMIANDEEARKINLILQKRTFPAPYGIGRRLHALYRVLDNPARIIRRARSLLARGVELVARAFVPPRPPPPPPPPKLLDWQPLHPPREPKGPDSS